MDDKIITLRCSPDTARDLSAALEREIDELCDAYNQGADEDVVQSQLATLLCVRDTLKDPLGRHYGYSDKRCTLCDVPLLPTELAWLQRALSVKPIAPLDADPEECRYGFNSRAVCLNCQLKAEVGT